MTNAHRPTWHSAAGGSEQGGNVMINPTRAYSSKDMPGHTVLKERQLGQGSREDLTKFDFRQDLLAREKLISQSILGKRAAAELEAELASDQQTKRIKLDVFVTNPFAQDADYQFEEESESAESDDEEAELRREYERIKREREEEARRKEQAKLEEIRIREQQEVIRKNPLLNQGEEYTLKRKWNEETVFRNQAKSEVARPKEHVNDTVRSAFHRKFMSRIIQ